MQEDRLATFDLVVARFHQPATGGGAITGIYVDMSTPQALRAVVRVTVSRGDRTAVSAGEILAAALETA
jgi:hypothetical protein